ncbi:hypothetical protein GCM10022199_04940 [Marihabitans asiaticum]
MSPGEGDPGATCGRVTPGRPGGLRRRGSRLIAAGKSDTPGQAGSAERPETGGEDGASARP